MTTDNAPILEVLKKITHGKQLTRHPQRCSDGPNYFKISEKQYAWLTGVIYKNWPNYENKYGAAVEDENGNLYGIPAANKGFYNVPKYIPNRASYGRNYYIHFQIK